MERTPVPALQAPGRGGSGTPLDPRTPCDAGLGSSPLGQSPARTGLRLTNTLHLSPSCFLTSGYSCCFFLRCVSPRSAEGLEPAG